MRLERVTDDAARFMVKARSQYDQTCRDLAADLLQARAERDHVVAELERAKAELERTKPRALFVVDQGFVVEPGVVIDLVGP